MANPDTVKLLKECNSGIKMGISAIEEVLPSIKDDRFREILDKSLQKHKTLGEDTAKVLDSVGDDGKEPHTIAKGMAWLKTNVMMAVEDTDKTAADLLTDGCHMGIKSINRYLNQYIRMWTGSCLLWYRSGACTDVRYSSRYASGRCLCDAGDESRRY